MKVVMIWFILFIAYSVIGWCVEMFVSAHEQKKIVNRGFLIGPYCPVYGVGCILMILLLNSYKSDFLVLFVMGAVLCTILEYFTGYIMEKIFKARWWSYYDYPFNLNGRVCLQNTIGFGFGAIVITYINIHILNGITGLSTNYLIIIFSILFVIFITDFIASFNIINKLKLTTLEIKKDSTDFITDKVKNVLIEKSAYFGRLLKAFPNIKLPNFKNVRRKFIKKQHNKK